MTLRQLRNNKGLTQKEASSLLGIPFRTYQYYEANENRINPIKYSYIMEKLGNYGYIDEEHGILTITQIQSICTPIFSKFNVEYAYLFGSYAKGKAKENSDVDLLVKTPTTGIMFYDLVETLRESLKKKVDVLNLEQLNNSLELTSEILKYGVRIYG